MTNGKTAKEDHRDKKCMGRFMRGPETVKTIMQKTRTSKDRQTETTQFLEDFQILDLMYHNSFVNLYPISTLFL